MANQPVPKHPKHVNVVNEDGKINIAWQGYFEKMEAIIKALQK
jgi:hypothetical protein